MSCCGEDVDKMLECWRCQAAKCEYCATSDEVQNQCCCECIVELRKEGLPALSLQETMILKEAIRDPAFPGAEGVQKRAIQLAVRCGVSLANVGTLKTVKRFLESGN